ncbi:MAG: hypothetical protein KGO50_05515 [Myxococcales bacterium]|nr:hypothetical protein [Myxococcales bacterium]
MGRFSVWTRAVVVASVSLCAVRCAESPGLSGAMDGDVSGGVDGGLIPVPDVGPDVDVSGASDVALDGQAEDAAFDGSSVVEDTGDVSPDAGGEPGTPCRADEECAGGDCVDR